ncbi:7791_t:CDS:2 [Diversispora eburnea]|uniref:7791_t:CDS:1 n=2 Tax=Diversisporales TaxID=214509 RepID=A0A9N8UXK2_9GLOM|nr:7791_t:CDS:2 [Diversispora eburnea]
MKLPPAKRRRKVDVSIKASKKIPTITARRKASTNKVDKRKGKAIERTQRVEGLAKGKECERVNTSEPPELSPSSSHPSPSTEPRQDDQDDGNSPIIRVDASVPIYKYAQPQTYYMDPFASDHLKLADPHLDYLYADLREKREEERRKFEELKKKCHEESMAILRKQELERQEEERKRAEATREEEKKKELIVQKAARKVKYWADMKQTLNKFRYNVQERQQAEVMLTYFFRNMPSIDGCHDFTRDMFGNNQSETPHLEFPDAKSGKVESPDPALGLFDNPPEPVPLNNPMINARMSCREWWWYKGYHRR